MHYSRAPISEAVIDLQTRFDVEPSLAALEVMASKLTSEFPQKHVINTFQVAFNQDADGTSRTDIIPPTVLGLRLTSSSQSRVLQLRTQGMSFSHLAPYTEWETFAAELRLFWTRYVDTFGPSQVMRLAVRYINRIELPQGSDLDKYLNVSPRLVPTVAAAVEGYFMQLVLPQRDLGPGWKAIINSGLEGLPAAPDRMNVLLDIDVFCETAIDPKSSDVWDTLSRLRDRKNLIFESAITDEVRRHII